MKNVPARPDVYNVDGSASTIVKQKYMQAKQTYMLS